MRYYISDLHFFHKRMIDHMDCRGFESMEEMHEYMIKKWNEKVRPNDEVVILGDLSIGNGQQTNEILDKLNGKLYLIKGNHDKWVNDKVSNAKRFVWIRDYTELKDNGRKVILSHYPTMCYNGQYRLNEDGSPKVYMLYGHVHNTMDQMLIDKMQEMTRNTYRKARSYDVAKPIPCNMLNTFCMYSDYTPMSLDEWIEINKKREENPQYESDWKYD